jgi:hypothetical protein
VYSYHERKRDQQVPTRLSFSRFLWLLKYENVLKKLGKAGNWERKMVKREKERDVGKWNWQ